MNIARILGCGLLVGVMLGSAQEHGDKSLAARVQRLEDQEEIRMLLVDYGRSLDARDFVKYASLFAKDGGVVGRFRNGERPGWDQGNDGQRNWVDARAAAELHLSSIDQFPRSMCMGTRAPRGSRWAFVVTTKENTPSILYGGHYDDVVVREDGHWKFKKRVAGNDIPHLENPAPAK